MSKSVKQILWNEGFVLPICDLYIVDVIKLFSLHQSVGLFGFLSPLAQDFKIVMVRDILNHQTRVI